MKEIFIDLSDLTTPRDICDIMYNRKVKYYTYGLFTHSSSAINFGKSTDNEWDYPEKVGTWGDRIYRKTCGIPGWNKQFDSTGAKEMRRLMKKYLPWLTRNNICIIIYDYTDELEDETDTEIERRILHEENELVREYERKYGSRPILNRQNTTSHLKPVPGLLYEVA